MDAGDWLNESEEPLDDDLHIKSRPNLEISRPKTELPSNDEVAERLRRSIAKGEWRKVHKICHENNWILSLESLYAPITDLGGTILHIAAYNKQEDIFGLLLQQLGPPGSLFTNECLKKKNIKGNTPLHHAASVGSVNMCKSIIEIAESTALLGFCNDEGETPLFIAASHNQKDAFHYLHDKVCSPEQRYKYCIRKNGDSILHCAISDEHYELSLIIVRHYKDLVNHPNGKGMTPLHLLASKPSAFKSGSDLRWFENIIYYSFVITDVQELIRSSAEQNLERDQVTHGRQQTFGSRRGATIAVSEVDEEDPERHRLTWGGYHSRNGARGHQVHLPSNYETCCLFVKVLFKAMLLIFEPLMKVRKVRKMKLRHTWSNLIMTELLNNFSKYQSSTQSSSLGKSENKKSERDKEKKEEHIDPPPDVILIAAKNGIIEMVERILEIYPVAFNEVDEKQKNIVLLTVEYKQPRMYELLLTLKKRGSLTANLFSEVDCDGNSVLHLAARKEKNGNWPVPGYASQMQWEIRWYEYIENSMESSSIRHLNKNGQTSEEIFTESHKDLVIKGGEWLTSASNVGMIVVGIFVTVTLTMSTTVLDSAKEGNKHEKPSKLFAGSSFVSFYTSLLAVVMFLSIATSRYRRSDFRFSLLGKLLVGLTALYASVVSTMISFSTGFFFIFRDQLQSAASSYVLACLLLITFFSLTQLPLYFHLVWATFTKVPKRNYRVTIPHWFYSED